MNTEKLIAPQRIELLNNALTKLKNTGIDQLKPQQRNFALMGFALAKFEEDIIFQISYTLGRDLIIEIERFLKDAERKRFIFLAKLGITESINEAGENDIQRIDCPEYFAAEAGLDFIPPVLASDEEAKEIFNSLTTV